MENNEIKKKAKAEINELKAGEYISRFNTLYETKHKALNLNLNGDYYMEICERLENSEKNEAKELKLIVSQVEDVISDECISKNSLKEIAKLIKSRTAMLKKGKSEKSRNYIEKVSEDTEGLVNKLKNIEDFAKKYNELYYELKDFKAYHIKYKALTDKYDKMKKTKIEELEKNAEKINKTVTDKLNITYLTYVLDKCYIEDTLSFCSIMFVVFFFIRHT